MAVLADETGPVRYPGLLRRVCCADVEDSIFKLAMRLTEVSVAIAMTLSVTIQQTSAGAVERPCRCVRSEILLQPVTHRLKSPAKGEFVLRPSHIAPPRRRFDTGHAM